MEKMNSIEIIDLNKDQSTVFRDTTTTPDGLPCITLKEPPKRRVLVSRHKNFTGRHGVPLPGHEYDFRRTPSTGRRTPRLLRPQVPPDTNDIDALRINLDGSPTPIKMRPRFRDRLDANRCPTPMPSEDDMRRVQGYRVDSSKAGLRGQNHRINMWHDKDKDNGMDTYGSTTVGGLITNRTNTGTQDDPYPDVDVNNDAIDSAVDFPSPNYFPNTFQNIRRQLTYRENTYPVIPVNFEPGRSLTPCPSSQHGLTVNVVKNYVQKQGYVNRERRIVNWLADCEEKAKAGYQVPAVLPEIANSKNNFSVTFTED